jgi:SAM-dependent methyltransferase
MPGPAVQPPEPESHQYRQVADSFGADAERYDRARPRYPQALVDRIVAAMPGRAVLDVGSGTGIVARQFQQAGCRVLGVDPDARMAGLARQLGLEVEVAKFEDWSPAGRRFDAVVAGQAWHWVDPVAGAAKAARALSPGGLLAAFWNAGQPPPDLARAFAEISEQLMPELPASASAQSAVQAYLRGCARVADAIREVTGFREAEQWRFGWEHPYTTEDWLDVLPTHGFHAQLPADRLALVLERTRTAIDSSGGRFTMSYSTVAVAAVRESDG